MKISENLGLTPSESFTLLNGRTKSSILINKKILSSNEFNLISEWYYYAILGVANLQTNVSSPHWIAKKLKLPLDLVRRAYIDLLKYQYIVEDKGQFKQSSPSLRTSDDVPSFRIRRYHKQNLHLASEKIDQIPPEFREFCTMTVPINKKKIKTAKSMIRKFKEDFSAELDRGNKNEVYNLCIQFFPLTSLED